MNIRLASLLFFYIAFSTSLHGNGEVSSKFVKCAEVVLKGLVHCSEKIGVFAYEGLVRSPEITKGAATIAVSSVVLYGTYKAVYVVPALFKYIKDSVSNLVFFPGRVNETNENVKLSVDKLESLDIKVDNLKKTVSSYANVFNQFTKCVLDHFSSIEKEQKEQAKVINRIDGQSKQVRQDVIAIDGKCDILINQTKKAAERARSIEFVVQQNNTMLNNLNVVNIPDALSDISVVVEQMCGLFEQIITDGHKNNLNTPVAIAQGGDGKEKELADRRNIFSESKNSKTAQIIEKVRSSEQKQKILESKVNETERTLYEIKDLLLKTLAAKDNEIQRVYYEANKTQQELLQCQIFIRLLEMGVNKKMEDEAKANGCVLVNTNKRSITQETRLTQQSYVPFGIRPNSNGLLLSFNGQ